MLATMLASTWNSTKNQYSDRRARPENVAYLERHAPIASPKPIAPPPSQSTLEQNVHSPAAAKSEALSAVFDACGVRPAGRTQASSRIGWRIRSAGGAVGCAGHGGDQGEGVRGAVLLAFFEVALDA